jgi:hypothetical protein
MHFELQMAALLSVGMMLHTNNTNCGNNSNNNNNDNNKNNNNSNNNYMYPNASRTLLLDLGSLATCCWSS